MLRIVGGLLVASLVAAGTIAGTAAPLGAAAAGAPSPYFAAPFTVTQNPTGFGQDPSWTADGRVLSNERDSSGVEQVYVSGLNGSARACLTCGQPGPNGFPQERPQGDWVLFCSWRGQTVTFGAPCLGGVGTDLYVMRPDGTHVTRLTGPGMSFEPNRVAADNYHPYWSPDGTRIVWTHVAFDPASQGGTHWTMLVADVVTGAGGAPHLGAVHVVGRPEDTGYETQVWAPDGSGFLYTAMGQGDAGWLNLELYFLRVSGHGASLEHPQVTHLTDDNPGWDEQAVFTPDMKDVVWMSSRGSPTWYQTFVTAAQQLGYDPPMQNETFGPMFVLAIRDPGFHTDLYELDLATHATRRLTDLHSIIPEFYFDPAGRRLLWSDGLNGATHVGRFALSRPPVGVGPRVAPVAAWRDAPVHAPATPAGRVGPAAPGPAATLPAPVVEGITLFETQLAGLAHQLGDLAQGPGCCRSPAG